MREMSIILQREFRELRQTTAFRIVVIVSAVIAIGAAVGISIVLGRQAWLGVPAARPGLELIIGLVVYAVPLLILLSFTWAFSTLAIVKEKVGGNIEALLATPLGPRTLWMGKCLAIFLPGYGISVIAALIVILTINLTTINPEAGYLVLPAPALITGLIINPLLFFGLIAFIVLFSLANNPDIAIAPSFLLGFSILIGFPIGITTGAINVASYTFALWYLVGTAAVWAVILYLTRLLTKEKIVLSSKGE